MGTGLIVAFVVTVWAAYFVPLALRRYDEAHAQSALELLSPLSRVIRRSDRKVETLADDDVEASAESAAAPRRAPRPGLTRASARLAARRRRRVLITLLGLTAVVSSLGGFALIPLWTIAIPATLLLAWLVACRLQVRSEYGHAPAKPIGLRLPKIPAVAKVKIPRADKPARPAKKDKKSKRADVLESEDTVIVAGIDDEVEPDRKHVMEEVALAADALDDQLVIAVPSAASHGEMVWDPLPVTLPTYVTKPRAGRTVRTIDFDAPGAWTSGHVEGEEVELPLDETAVDDPQRRVAGE